MWEARYKKGISLGGKTIYGAVYGKSREKVIRKRLFITKENSGVMRVLLTELKLIILGAGRPGRNIKAIAESLRVLRKFHFWMIM